ncbi:MAG: PepSY-associated TM helix domain-containing protein [Acidobacteria bacterium]|nr:PepSY-associated TM helix domain-containing protein [Acidobacteriota bacterium]
MHSAGKPLSRRLFDAFEVWNRKLHFYLGLYLLFFLWLFALTGLLLNHPKWTFADFWPNRRETTTVRSMAPLGAGDDLTQARAILGQLGLTGEINWTRTRQSPAQLDFGAARPGYNYDVKADLEHHQVTLKQIDLNAWGVMHNLHVFTGVRLGDSRNSRDWVLTSLWALSMDLVAAGLIFMVLSSVYMWYGLKRKRLLGLMALFAGCSICGILVVGLRWIYQPL